MKRWKVWTGVIILFLSGAAVGGLTTGLVIRHNIHRFVRGGPRNIHERIVERMFRDIDLSAGQQEAVDNCISISMDEFKLYAKEARAMRDSVVARQHAAIRAILTPAQEAVFERNLAEMENERRRFGPPPGGPDGQRDPRDRPDRRPPPPPEHDR